MAWSRKLLTLVILSTAYTISGAETDPSSSTPAADLITETDLKATTTVAPSTSKSTPLPVTTTVPPHVKDTWVVKDNVTGRVCIVAHMSLLLDIPYNNTYSKKVEMAHVEVPDNATGSGICNISNPAAMQQLSLEWGSLNHTNTVTMKFASNVTSKQFWVESIAAKVSVDYHTFPNISDTVKEVNLVNDSSKHFVTPFFNSYNCPTKINIPAKETPLVVNHTAYFTIQNFQLEAFKNSSNNQFSTAIYCEGDNTPDLVPVLVGCTLVALVAVVLGVYLWGRRRSQGYHSM